MLKCLLFFVFSNCFITSIIAQYKIPSFGSVAKADLELKECPFEKDAPSMVLFNVGESYCQLSSTGLSTIFTKHKRVKIFNNIGLKQADVRIRMENDKRTYSFKKFRAQTYNLDAVGNVVSTKVERNAMYEKEINKRYKEVIFSFPEVKVGSIVEYEYEIDNSEYAEITEWQFQDYIPVQYSSYTLDFPNELEVNAVPAGIFEVSKKIKEKSSRQITQFFIENVPAFKREPFMTNMEDYISKVKPLFVAANFANEPRRNLLRQWPEVINSLWDDDDFGVQLKKEIPRTSELDIQIKATKNDYEKMKVIHQYVRTQMKWDENYSIWALYGVKSAWRDKKGTVGEINLILVNLLRDAGLEAYPVLVSTRSNGRADAALVKLTQFNKVMAYVRLNNRIYILDGSEKITPSNLIPNEVLASYGLVVNKIDKGYWGWRLLQNDSVRSSTAVNYFANIDKNGTISGNGLVSSFNYEKLTRLTTIATQKEKFADMHLLNKDDDITIMNLQLNDADDDNKPLNQQFDFKGKVTNTGEYSYATINLFSELFKNPFTDENRITDVFFGYPFSTSIRGAYKVDAQYTVEELPKNTKMIMPDTSIVFKRTMYKEGDEVICEIEVHYKSPIYSYDVYELFAAFHQKMYTLLAEPIVLKKK